MKHEFKKGGTYYTLRTDVNPVQVLKCVVTSSGGTYLNFTAERDLSNSHKRNVSIYLDSKYVDFDGENFNDVGVRECIYLTKDAAIKGAKDATERKIWRAKQRIEQEFSVEFEVLE